MLILPEGPFTLFLLGSIYHRNHHRVCQPDQLG